MCKFTSNSDQLFRKHQNKTHKELARPLGRPRKEQKKSRAEINRDYRAKKAAKQPATRSSSVPTSRASPKKKPLPFTKVEPSTSIGAIWWLPELDANEALDLMKQEGFWHECFKNNLDPLWAYRYLCWRLGHPSKKKWRRYNTLPGPQQVFRVVVEVQRRELRVDDDDECVE